MGACTRFSRPITVDCSGREQVATARDGWRVRDEKLNKLAIWTYFRGAKRDPGIDEGNTTVAYVADRGWFWYIPLRGDIVSVGIVAEKDYLFGDLKEPAAIFQREIGRNAWITGSPADGPAGGGVFGDERVFVSRRSIARRMGSCWRAMRLPFWIRSFPAESFWR